LVRVLQKYNYPGTPPLRLVFDTDAPNALEIAEAAKLFFEMGGAISENQLREVLGLEEPQPVESILAQMQSLSPAAAAGVMPEGIPKYGPSGAETGGSYPYGRRWRDKRGRRVSRHY